MWRRRGRHPGTAAAVWNAWARIGRPPGTRAVAPPYARRRRSGSGAGEMDTVSRGADENITFRRCGVRVVWTCAPVRDWRSVKAGIGLRRLTLSKSVSHATAQTLAVDDQ
ncbi:hypothetical protein GCM10020218_026010 [Dactylosporangium vinaceum]